VSIAEFRALSQLLTEIAGLKEELFTPDPSPASESAAAFAEFAWR
jgi:hypothetical protein